MYHHKTPLVLCSHPLRSPQKNLTQKVHFQMEVPSAMGKGAYKCIFEHGPRMQAPRLMIMALYPPSNSVVTKEHDNRTSLEIFKVTGNYEFYWNDIFPYAPSENKLVNQKELADIIADNKMPILLENYYKRSQIFIEHEHSAGNNWPVILVAGETANMAFSKIYTNPISYFVVSGLRVKQFDKFIAIEGADHPSFFLMSGGDAKLHQAFKETWLIADALRQHPYSEANTLLDVVGAEVSRRHRSMMEALQKLNIPNANGWIDEEYRHLRLVDWTVQLVHFTSILDKVGHETFLFVVKYSVGAHMTSEYAGCIIKYATLFGKDFKTIACNGFFSILGKPGGNAIVDKYATKFGKDFKTIACDGFFSKISTNEDEFIAVLDALIARFGIDMVSAVIQMCSSRILDTEYYAALCSALEMGPRMAGYCHEHGSRLIQLTNGFDAFYASTPTWTQELSRELNKKIPIGNEKVKPEVWMEIYNARNKRKK